MAALCSAVDSLGPFVDGDAILDGILRRSRSAWPVPFVTTREITPQLLGPLGCPIDEGVDRLALAARRRRSFSPFSQPEICSESNPPRGSRQRRLGPRSRSINASC